MSRPRVHYEVLVRRRPDGDFALDSAGEDRAAALEAAEALAAEGRFNAVRVVKEVMHPATGEFSGATIFERVLAPARAPRRCAATQTRAETPCTSPADLYGLHARETIGRVLGDWLAREGVTPYELLHRADLVERLDAAPTERLHACQKVAVAQAQASGRPVHELLKPLQALVDRASARVLKDARSGAFPDLAAERSGPVADHLHGQPDAAYRLAGGVCALLVGLAGWGAKLNRLLDLAEDALGDGETGAPVLAAIEPLLVEVLESRAALADLLGVQEDLGCDLGALTRLAAADAVETAARADPRVARLIPPLAGPAVRLGRSFAAGAFTGARRGVARRILAELNGGRRLRPASPAGEIDVLRALATALSTAAAGDALVDAEDLRRAFVDRSRDLLSPDFTTAYLAACPSALAEAEALVWLSENVAGAANKRAAARLLNALLIGHRLERELHASGEPPAARLAGLARLQRAVRAVGFQPEDEAPLVARVGELGGLVESEVRLITALTRADAETHHKLFLLTKLASGESAPIGPVTDRARDAALTLMRRLEVADHLAASPELRNRLRALLPTAA